MLFEPTFLASCRSIVKQKLVHTPTIQIHKLQGNKFGISEKRAMRREDEGEVKVGIPIKDLWKALTVDFKSVVPPTIPGLVKELDILEGDGGSGTVYLFKFGPDVPNMSYQKEKIVDFDESLFQIGLEVMEGGRLTSGFTYYKTTFQLNSVGDSETLVVVKVDFETECQQTRAPEETIKSGVAFIQSLQDFLHKQHQEC